MVQCIEWAMNPTTKSKFMDETTEDDSRGMARNFHKLPCRTVEYNQFLTGAQQGMDGNGGNGMIVDSYCGSFPKIPC